MRRLMLSVRRWGSRVPTRIPSVELSVGHAPWRLGTVLRPRHAMDRGRLAHKCGLSPHCVSRLCHGVGRLRHRVALDATRKAAVADTIGRLRHHGRRWLVIAFGSARRVDGRRVDRSWVQLGSKFLRSTPGLGWVRHVQELAGGLLLWVVGCKGMRMVPCGCVGD